MVGLNDLFCTFHMGLKLAVFVSDKVPEIVVGDPGRFRQVITNLVGNSVKVSVAFQPLLILSLPCTDHHFGCAPTITSL